MEMHQIRYFLCVAKTLNFTHAADECHVAQPSLSRAVKKLEEELGGDLFRRERSGLALKCCLLEQLVVRRDDVLDLRAVLGLLQTQSVDEDGLVGYGRCDPLELGKLASRGDDLFQDLGGLEALWAQAVEGRERSHGSSV